MRWIDKKPSRGDERIVRGFLFLPRKIGNQYRWLEFAEWRQKYVQGYFTHLSLWADIAWVDDEILHARKLREDIEKYTSSITKGTPE